MKRALITGITGQDGSYLAELLLAKGYEVHGLIRDIHTRAKEAFGFVARTSFEEGMRQTIDWYEANRSPAMARASSPTG